MRSKQRNVTTFPDLVRAAMGQYLHLARGVKGKVGFSFNDRMDVRGYQALFPNSKGSRSRDFFGNMRTTSRAWGFTRDDDAEGNPVYVHDMFEYSATTGDVAAGNLDAAESSSATPAVAETTVCDDKEATAEEKVEDPPAESQYSPPRYVSYTKRLLRNVRPFEETREVYVRAKRARMAAREADARRATERKEALRREREAYLNKDDFFSTPCPKGGRQIPPLCAMTRQQAYEYEKRLGLRK